MTISIVPHAATPASSRTLHLWVGIDGAAGIPNLSWRLDGAVVNPVPVRQLAPTYPNSTVLTGFFEIGNLNPDQTYQIELSAGPESVARTVQTPPETVPFGPQERLNVLLMSCFHRLEDKTGVAGKVMAQLNVRPHLTLFMGDQVYLDLPTIRNFKKSTTWLRNKFQGDYVENWFGDRIPRPAHTIPDGFPQLLSLAPAIFAPDDHEYWNNFPYASPFIENTWDKAGRGLWRRAAEEAYNGFQQSGAVPFGAPRIVAIDPLSIIVLDSRSQRHDTSRSNSGDLLGQQGRQALAAWTQQLVQSAAGGSPKFGMLVTGQSLFRAAVGKLEGKIADFEFPDYEADFAFMREQLESVSKAGLPVLCITGDVHWGRVLFADDPSGTNAPVFEVISSPLSLVSTVFQDQSRRLWGALKNVFGSRDPWPRHSDAEEPAPRFGSTGQYATKLVRRTDNKNAVMRGNHAAMLRFARAGTGLDVEVVYYPLHSDDAVNQAEQWSTRFELRAIR